MKKKVENLVIFGLGDHAKVIVSEIKQIKNYKVKGFVCDNINYSQKAYLKANSFKYFGNVKNFFKYHNNKKLKGIIAIGANYKREKIVKEIELLNKNFQWAKIISKNTVINGKVKFGDGSVLISGCIVNTGTIIRNHCLINTKTVIDHDNIFENYSSTGPGSITGGNVKVGERSHLGIGSVVKNKINIKSDTIIGGKSFVNKNCKSKSIYFGIPAKWKKFRKKNQKYL